MGWLSVGYLSRALGYFGLIVVLTRALGPVGFGSLSLFLAVTLGVSQVAGSWPFLAVPVLSAHGRTIGAAFRPAAYVAAMATAAALVVAVPVSIAIQSRAPTSILAVITYSIALVALQGIYAVQQTEGRMSGIAALQTGERVLALVLALGAAAIVTLDVLDAELLLTASAVVTCIAAFATVGRRQRLLHRHADDIHDHRVSAVMASVGAMGVVSLCSYGIAWVDIFVLAAFRNNAEVGIYSLAYQIFTFIAQLGALWAVAALPGHARSSASGDSLAAQLPMPRLIAYQSLWAALMAAGGVCCVIVLPHAFGHEFSDAQTPLLVLLAGSGVCAATYFAVLPGLIGASRSGLVARVAGGSVLINLTLDLILVPKIGVLGPALATVAQSLFGTAGLAGLTLGWRPTLRLLVASLPAMFALSALAIDPDDIGLILLCAVTAIVTGLWGLDLTRRAGGLPTAAGA